MISSTPTVPSLWSGSFFLFTIRPLKRANTVPFFRVAGLSAKLVSEHFKSLLSSNFKCFELITELFLCLKRVKNILSEKNTFQIPIYEASYLGKVHNTKYAKSVFYGATAFSRKNTVYSLWRSHLAENNELSLDRKFHSSATFPKYPGGHLPKISYIMFINYGDRKYGTGKKHSANKFELI